MGSPGRMAAVHPVNKILPGAGSDKKRVSLCVRCLGVVFLTPRLPMTCGLGVIYSYLARWLALSRGPPPDINSGKVLGL